MDEGASPVTQERPLRDPAHRVSPRARWRWMLGATTLALVVMAAGVLAVLWRDEVAWWWLLPLGAGAAAYAVGMPRWRYRVHRWEVTSTAVYTQTGWWTRERRIAPMSRIQTVDYAQDILDRLFRLATVTVTTASAAGPLEITGLDARDARRLADDLTLAADAIAGDAT